MRHDARPNKWRDRARSGPAAGCPGCVAQRRVRPGRSDSWWRRAGTRCPPAVVDDEVVHLPVDVDPALTRRAAQRRPRVVLQPARERRGRHWRAVVPWPALRRHLNSRADIVPARARRPGRGRHRSPRLPRRRPPRCRVTDSPGAIAHPGQVRPPDPPALSAGTRTPSTPSSARWTRCSPRSATASLPAFICYGTCWAPCATTG